MASGRQDDLPSRAPAPAPAAASALAGFFRGGLELQMLEVVGPFDVDADPVLALECAAEDLLGERVFDEVLDRPAERTRTVVGVEALGDDEVLGLVGEDEFQAAVGQPAADLRQLDVDDLLEVVLVQRVEHDHVVEPVEELGPEVLLDGDLRAVPSSVS